MLLTPQGSRIQSQHPPVRSPAAFQAAVKGLALGKKAPAMPRCDSEGPALVVAGSSFPLNRSTEKSEPLGRAQGHALLPCECTLAQGCVTSVLLMALEQNVRGKNGPACPWRRVSEPQSSPSASSRPAQLLSLFQGGCPTLRTDLSNRLTAQNNTDAERKAGVADTPRLVSSLALRMNFCACKDSDLMSLETGKNHPHFSVCSAQVEGQESLQAAEVLQQCWREAPSQRRASEGSFTLATLQSSPSCAKGLSSLSTRLEFNATTAGAQALSLAAFQRCRRFQTNSRKLLR